MEEGSTAGWPTYFWLMPNEAIIAALIPEGFRGSGIPHARKYFGEYLKVRSGYCRPGGYNRPGSHEPLPLVPRFETNLARTPGRLDEIANKWEDIRKYVTRTSYEPPRASAAQTSDIQSSIRSWLPESVRRTHVESKRRKPRTFDLEADWRPNSRDAVVQVIRAWDDEISDDNYWAGVRDKDGRLYRFDNMICREPIAIAGELDTDPRWDTETLLRAWEEARLQAHSLISQLRGRDSSAQNQP